MSARGRRSDFEPGRLYEQYGPALHRYALMILTRRQDSEDAVQQVFLALLKKPLNLGVDSVEAYLRRAVRNACLNALRSRRHESADRMDRLLEHATAPEESADDRLAIEAALRMLPPEQREAVHLRVFEGWTLQEIASLTGESINTVASRYRYAMEKMQDALGVGHEHGRV